MKPNDTHIVLLHGAGTGPWIWDRVVSQLSSPALVPAYPGQDEGATPGLCVDAISEELERHDVRSAVLVLHSLAGVLAPALYDRLGERCRHCIYVSAVVPPAGGAFVDALGPLQRTILRLLFRFNRGGLRPSSAMIRRELCNDLDSDDADRIVSSYVAQKPGLYLTPVGPPPTVRTTYVKLLIDHSVTTKQQETMIARLSEPRVHEIDSGHMVMLSQPYALAKVINEVVT